VNEVIDEQTARVMMTMLKDVTEHGTGQQAAKLDHPFGGKTGTTSDFTDAWFLGFSPSVTCGVWVGYDNRQSLGEKETGAIAALPIWITFMKQAIVGKDGEQFPGDDDAPPMDEAKLDQPGPAHFGSAAADRSVRPAGASGHLLTPPAFKPPARPLDVSRVSSSRVLSTQVHPALPHRAAPGRPHQTAPSRDAVRHALPSGPAKQVTQ
jgi:penicillin-binding protein 1A